MRKYGLLKPPANYAITISPPCSASSASAFGDQPSKFNERSSGLLEGAYEPLSRVHVVEVITEITRIARKKLMVVE
ncbi:MAG: hypothetical protein EA358_02765 [Flavobacteriales bacterium]|nr:MAG: hypothetical protein EA358_02765 [Flavobacteriales bacterium]